MAGQKVLSLEAPISEFHIRSKAALNPVDWEDTRPKHLCQKHYPAILGFVKGDRVVHQGWFSSDKAAFQQFIVVLAEITAKIPSNISFDEAAPVPLCLATVAAEGGEGLYRGKSIVIFGGPSSVGQYVIQLAKLSGLSPIIKTACLHSTDLLKSPGASHVIDRNAVVPAEAKKILGDILTEFIYGSQWKILRTRHGICWRPETDKLAGNNAIRPNRIEVLPNGLAGISHGLDRLKKNKVSGSKLVARPLETA
ncbi:hypothetical protein ACEPAI_7301 [Sanghuangporus weigelae]